VAEFIDDRKTPGHVKIRRKKLLLYSQLPKIRLRFIEISRDVAPSRSEVRRNHFAASTPGWLAQALRTTWIVTGL
jgi:hypothetical protein